MTQRLLRNGLFVLAMLLVYSRFPVPGRGTPALLDWLIFVLGMVGIVYAVYALVRKERTSPGDAGVKVEALVGVAYLVIAFFSLVYLGLSAHRGEFTGLHNRVDALYFTMSTLSSVGYGDVHASGSEARIAVTVQLFFDIAFLGVAARILVPSMVRRRRRERDAVTPEG